MKLTLERTDYLEHGIYGRLLNDKNDVICSTLEHAYDTNLSLMPYAPKMHSGEYKCVRGQHRLASMNDSFTTFEITNVPDHTDILFHKGNYNKDSEGCVLLGINTDLPNKMIRNS